MEKIIMKNILNNNIVQNDWRNREPETVRFRYLFKKISKIFFHLRPAENSGILVQYGSFSSLRGRVGSTKRVPCQWACLRETTFYPRVKWFAEFSNNNNINNKRKYHREQVYRGVKVQRSYMRKKVRSGMCFFFSIDGQRQSRFSARKGQSKQPFSYSFHPSSSL